MRAASPGKPGLRIVHANRRAYCPSASFLDGLSVLPPLKRKMAGGAGVEPALNRSRAGRVTVTLPASNTDNIPYLTASCQGNCGRRLRSWIVIGAGRRRGRTRLSASAARRPGEAGPKRWADLVALFGAALVRPLQLTPPIFQECTRGRSVTLRMNPARPEVVPCIEPGARCFAYRVDSPLVLWLG
jgi:hypothetical protein